MWDSVVKIMREKSKFIARVTRKRKRVVERDKCIEKIIENSLENENRERDKPKWRWHERKKKKDAEIQ